MTFKKLIIPFCILLFFGGGYLILSINSPAEKALLEAAGVGDLNRVEEAIQAGVYVNVRDFDRGATPLVVATMNNHVNVVKKLVRAGADVNAKDGGGSVLYYACLNGYEDLIGYLHSAGARLAADNTSLEKLRQKKDLPPLCR
jgi:ankyrin repeat protein